MLPFLRPQNSAFPALIKLFKQLHVRFSKKKCYRRVTMITINDNDRPVHPKIFPNSKNWFWPLYAGLEGPWMQSRIGSFFGEGFRPSKPIKSRKVVAKPREKNVPCAGCGRMFATEANLSQHAAVQKGVLESLRRKFSFKWRKNFPNSLKQYHYQYKQFRHLPYACK